jgi:hypothetical protein
MENAGKILVGLGALLLFVGVLVWGAGRLGFRGLPGDIRYQGEHVKVYFPIVTSIALSVLLTLGLWLWQRISK